MPASTLHNDLPTLDDKLGWSNELDRLSQRIQSCDTPHVLGIHGDWGSGKTSFMRQLQWRLGGVMPDDGSFDNRKKPTQTPAQKKGQEKLQKEIITIWFDAWRYQNEPMPVVALLQEMRRQIAVLPAVIKKFEKLGEISLRYTLNSLSDIGKSIGLEGILPNADKIEKLGESWEKKHNAHVLNTDTIRGHLQETIKCLLPKECDTARVVVFIDDLDRCNPKAAIRLLEGLKIYLSIPDCVFVLGVNERMLVDAICEETSAPKETSPEELKLRATHYFEKICTDIYRLPLPNDPLVLLTGWIKNKPQGKILISAIDKTVCLPPNPRRLKALANQWERFAKCTPYPDNIKEKRVWAVRVLVAAYIHQFHRDLWERWHFNPHFWSDLVTWCNGELITNDLGIPRKQQQWARALKLTGWKNQDDWVSNFPNPGDIDIFWIDGLIRKHRDYLVTKDFIPLLNNGAPRTPTKP